MKHEQWRDIANFNGNYKVSNFGRVQSVERTEIVENKRTRKRNGRILKHGRHPNGYHYVNLCLNGQCKPHFVHRLVAAAFVGDPTGLTVNHLNCCKTDNHADNLEIVTIGENVRHAIANNRWKNNRLSAAERLQVCAMHAHGVKQCEIAEQFGVNGPTIRRCVEAQHKNPGVPGKGRTRPNKALSADFVS